MESYGIILASAGGEELAPGVVGVEGDGVAGGGMSPLRGAQS